MTVSEVKTDILFILLEEHGEVRLDVNATGQIFKHKNNVIPWEVHQ